MAVMVRPVTMTLGTSGRGKVINFLIKGDIMSTVRMARYLVHEIKDKFEENFNKAYPEKEIPTTRKCNYKKQKMKLQQTEQNFKPKLENSKKMKFQK